MTTIANTAANDCEVAEEVEFDSLDKKQDKKRTEEDDVIISDAGLLYGINDTPEWFKCIVLGIQHYLVALGGIISVPLLLSEGICLSDTSVGYLGTSMLISTPPATVALLFLFTYYLENVRMPYPAFDLKTRKFKLGWSRLFKMFPVLLALTIAWLFCIILTETNVLPSDSNAVGYRARTDIRSDVLANSPWFRVPYPWQWGSPVVTFASVGIVGAIGDYYACARLCGAAPPLTNAVNRGIAMEGFGCIFASLMGTAGGTASYSENIGALGITRVGSRKVIQVAGLVFIVLGMFGKIGAIFVTIPDAVVGGIFCVMFGMVTAVGLSSVQYIDLNSTRNLMVLEFSIFMGLSIPEWLRDNPGAINTGVVVLDQTLTVLLTTAMFVGGAFGLFLDNTIPGSIEERGIVSWRSTFDEEGDSGGADMMKKCYHLPFKTDFRYSKYIPFLPDYNKTT